MEVIKEIVVLKTSYWEIIASISTLLAVITALFLSFYQSRRKISVRVGISPKYVDNKKATIFIVNESNNSETVSRVLFKSNGDKYYKELVQVNSDLPATLQAHGVLELDSPALTNLDNAITDICVEDSIGKRWKCNKKNFAYGIKLLQNHKGTGGLMYDRSDNDEV